MPQQAIHLSCPKSLSLEICLVAILGVGWLMNTWDHINVYDNINNIMRLSEWFFK